MKKLFKNKKGFTLMEMLIVVGIIVILVAVAMPVFSGQLAKAKDATNDANMRAAKAAAVAEYLSNGKTTTDGKPLYFDAADGTLKDSQPATGYGKGVDSNNSQGYEAVTEGAVIEVTIDADGTVKTEWVGKSTGGSTGGDNTQDEG